MILTSTTDIAEVFAESLEAGLKEAIPLVFKMFWDGIVQCAIDYPLLIVIVVVLIFLNHRKKK